MSLLTCDEFGMGDHLRVGPQYYPAASRGTPIIQRGEHGAWLGRPVPVRTGAAEPQFQLAFYEGTQRQPGVLNVPQQRVTQLMGMGAMKGELPDDKKNAYSRTAEALAAASKTANTFSAPAFRDQARRILEDLDAHQAFEASYMPIRLGGYNQSQTIRANLQITLQNTRRVLEGEQPLQLDTAKDTSSMASRDFSTFTRDVERTGAELSRSVQSSVASTAKTIGGLTPTNMLLLGVGTVAFLSFTYGAGRGLTA